MLCRLVGICGLFPYLICGFNMFFPSVIGHRGAAGYACENSRSSFYVASALGVRAVEVDCMLSGDGRVILFHDDDLQKLGGCGAVPAFTSWEELRECPLRFCYEGGELRGRAVERILAIEDFLEIMDELDFWVNFEIKPGWGNKHASGERLAQIFNDAYPRQAKIPLISAFDKISLRAFQESIKIEADYALLYRKLPRYFVDEAFGYAVKAIHLEASQCLGIDIAMVRDVGLDVGIYTVNSAVAAMRFWRWGASALFSDFPDRVCAENLLLLNNIPYGG